MWRWFMCTYNLYLYSCRVSCRVWVMCEQRYMYKVPARPVPAQWKMPPRLSRWLWTQWQAQGVCTTRLVVYTIWSRKDLIRKQISSATCWTHMVVLYRKQGTGVCQKTPYWFLLGRLSCSRSQLSLWGPSQLSLAKRRMTSTYLGVRLVHAAWSAGLNCGHGFLFLFRNTVLSQTYNGYNI